MLEAFFGTLGGILLMMLRDTFYKGKNQQKIESMEKEIQKINETNTEMRDKIETSIGELNKNIGANNQAIASLDATLKGVNTLLKHLIEGNLKIADS